MAKTGSFDLNFPGANIICDTPQKRESLLKYINGDSESYEVKLSYIDFEDDIEKAIYNTTYIHEGKHFLDHLIYPYLLHNTAAKIDVFYHFILAVLAWNSGSRPFKWMPCPFVYWLQLPNDKKFELIKKRGMEPSDVPIFSFKDAALVALGKNECANVFTKNILIGATSFANLLQSYEVFDPDGNYTSFNVKSFCESSAFIQQGTEIIIKYGDYGQKIHNRLINNFFQDVNELSKKENEDKNYDQIDFSTYIGPTYQILHLINALRINPKYLYPFISYMLFWALSGVRYNLSAWSKYPRNRIEALIHIVKKENIFFIEDSVIIDFFKNPIKTFIEWDEKIKHLYKTAEKEHTSRMNALNFKFSESLSYNEYYDRYIIDLTRRMKYLESVGLSKSSNYVYQIINAIHYLKGLFCDNPSLYLYPSAYSKYIYRNVSIPFRFEFNNIEPIRELECKTLRNDIFFKGDYIYGNSLIPTNQKKIVDCKSLEEISPYLDFTDSIYGFSKINMPGVIIRDILPGIKPWFFKNSID